MRWLLNTCVQLSESELVWFIKTIKKKGQFSNFTLETIKGKNSHFLLILPILLSRTRNTPSVLFHSAHSPFFTTHIFFKFLHEIQNAMLFPLTSNQIQCYASFCNPLSFFSLNWACMRFHVQAQFCFLKWVGVEMVVGVGFRIKSLENMRASANFNVDCADSDCWLGLQGDGRSVLLLLDCWVKIFELTEVVLVHKLFW